MMPHSHIPVELGMVLSVPFLGQYNVYSVTSDPSFLDFQLIISITVDQSCKAQETCIIKHILRVI